MKKRKGKKQTLEELIKNGGNNGKQNGHEAIAKRRQRISVISVL